MLNQVKNTRTTARDERFNSTNQAMHCWNRYNEWLVCIKQTDDDESCAPLRQSADSICPSVWTDQWDEERDVGTFSGIGSRYKDAKHAHH